MAARLVFWAKNAYDYGRDPTTYIQLCSGQEFTVKRTPDSQPPSQDLVTFIDGCMHIDSPLISENHFRIYTIQYEDDDGMESMFYCEDLDSANGTYVNNILVGKNKEPSNPFLLSDGDMITLQGRFLFLFKQAIERQRGKMDALQLADTASFEQRYSISDRLLGSGINGKVYLAMDMTTRRQLACKVVNLDILAAASESDPANAPQEQEKSVQRDKLMREVEILKMLNHPNIVSMKKAFRSTNTLYLFMELAPGGDLCSFVSANGGRLDDLATRVIIRQITIAVQYLHYNGIVHRDIKPENILMMNTAVGHRVALADFGCAVNINLVKRMETLVGTADYVAPEVHRTELLSGKPYTKAVDMWSLGIVGLCLLTGEQLASFQEMKHIGQKDIAVRLGRRVPGSQDQQSCLTDRAKDFLMKLLTLDHTDRMTADQAVKHDWFTRPSEIGHELSRLYRRSVEGWEPRQMMSNTLESISRRELPRRTIKNLPRQRQATFDGSCQVSRVQKRCSSKSTDYTASVYFSLDKHTRKHDGRRRQREKKRIINNLQKSGKLFVKDGDVSSYTSPSHQRAVMLASGLQDVPPTNLFGNVPAGVESQKARRKRSRDNKGSSNAAARLNHYDPSQTQLEQPSLPSEASSMVSFDSDDERRSKRRHRVSFSSSVGMLGEASSIQSFDSADKRRSKRRRRVSFASSAGMPGKAEDDGIIDDEEGKLPVGPDSYAGSSVMTEEMDLEEDDDALLEEDYDALLKAVRGYSGQG